MHPGPCPARYIYFRITNDLNQVISTATAPWCNFCFIWLAINEPHWSAKQMDRARSREPADNPNVAQKPKPTMLPVVEAIEKYQNFLEVVLLDVLVEGCCFDEIKARSSQQMWIRISTTLCAAFWRHFGLVTTFPEDFLPGIYWFGSLIWGRNVLKWRLVSRLGELRTKRACDLLFFSENLLISFASLYFRVLCAAFMDAVSTVSCLRMAFLIGTFGLPESASIDPRGLKVGWPTWAFPHLDFGEGMNVWKKIRFTLFLSLLNWWLQCYNIFPTLPLCFQEPGKRSSALQLRDHEFFGLHIRLKTKMDSVFNHTIIRKVIYWKTEVCERASSRAVFGRGGLWHLDWSYCNQKEETLKEKSR